ncbi:nucleoside triphosphate pyrophosphohydrolase [Desulfovibrio sp. OttesenSCG-928-C14]|nr:nucleoside triphosphate pyrophosphohydrolase [Desulfovibrio sp. OttesenSCG-928-C14]
MSKDTEQNHSANAAALEKVSRMLEVLIGPRGCPWDKAQTLETLADYLLEETYELIDSIRNGGAAQQREEWGDVFFILLFMAQVAAREGRFTLPEALEENHAKMTGRHPHVFGDIHAESTAEIIANWEKIKKAEKARKQERPGVFGSLPVELPPLYKAYRIHSKSASNNFTWDTDEDADQQVEAEWLEWYDACASGDKEAQEHELGDLIFSLVEAGRRRGIKAGAALDKTNARFLRRFAAMEALAAKRGQDFNALSQAEKDQLWDEVKRGEGKGQA